MELYLVTTRKMLTRSIVAPLFAGEFTFREEVQAFIAGLEHLTG